MSTAVVVGSGPNGLAAAVALAKEGVQVTVLEAADEIGGGTRTSEAIVPGLLHDHCSAFHPMAVGSTFLNEPGLDRYGLQWRWPEIDCVHPLDDGDAGVLLRSLDDTAAALGATGRGGGGRSAGLPRPSTRWPRTSWDRCCGVPTHPLTLARFGAPTVLPASTLARVFRTEQGRALFGGVAAHTFRPLHQPMTSAIGLGIITAGHRYGWPVAAGGSAVDHRRDGVAARRSRRQDRDRGADRLGRATAARGRHAVRPRPDRGRRASSETACRAGWLARFRRFRHGPGAFKVDFAVEGGVPWTNDAAHNAGTVHLGGDFAEIAATERDDPRGADARAAVRARRAAVPRGPAPLRRRHAPGVDVRACPARLHG